MNSKMLAAVFEGEGKFVLKEVSIPKIEENDDVILRVESVSICGTDVHIVEVPPRFIATPNTILGHELSGYVEKVGPNVKTLKKGDRVVVNPNDYDGICYNCKLNFPNQCENLLAMGIHVNGGFAKFCKVTEKVCHKISALISSDVAALAEPLACVINGAQKVRMHIGESVIIFGAGPIGLLFLKLFKLSGASKVIVSELSEYRRNFAKDFGADVIIDPLTENLKDIIKKETVAGVDIVVDSVGSLLELGIEVVKRNGTILVFGANTKAITQFPQFLITSKEVKIFGTWLANATFPMAVRIIESGVMDLEKLITHKFSLEDIHKGINLLAEGKAIKVIINP